MNKQHLLDLIKEVAIKTVNEMARIPSLVHLATTDKEELENMIPPDLMRSSVVKNIIDYYLANGNQPAKISDIVKAYGYPAQQAVNTQFQKLKNLQVIVDKGYAFPKREIGPKTSRINHQTGVFDQSDDNKKLGYIIQKIRMYQNVPDMYKNWFVEKYGEENFQKLKDLVDTRQNTITKAEESEAAIAIRNFVLELGFQLGRRGRKPIDRTLNTQPPSPEDEADIEDDEDIEDELV